MRLYIKPTDPTQRSLFDNGKNNQISQDEINGILWKACDTFRGTVDPPEYKNYIQEGDYLRLVCLCLGLD